jgi:mannan endo-1,4-beta-mannosidase
MSRIFRLAACLGLAVMCSVMHAAPARKSDFVSVRGMHFARHGKLYYISGANFWYGGYLGAAGGVGNRARLAKELDNLKALGVNNVRVLAVSEQTAMTSAVRPATTIAPGQYDESLLAGLDFLMAELGKRDMTAVLYLNNFWQWSGGMTQYLNWFEGTPALDPNVTGDYETYMAQTARFYVSEAAQAEYRRVIEKIVGRVNTVTGLSYRDDPTIMAWQLANEPRPGGSKAGDAEKAIYIRWIDATAKTIHDLDPNHLVSSGSEGLAGSAEDGKLYLAAHASANIDYLTYHLWPKNWGWFDSKKPEETWANAIARSRDYLNVHIDMARHLKKPVVLEEFGLDRDGPSFSANATTRIRDRFYSEVFELIERRAAHGDPIAGWNFWAWGGAGRAANADYLWREGDDFLGDPPQEEQGLYSVFDLDATSLVLIKKHAGKLKKLQNNLQSTGESGRDK